MRISVCRTKNHATVPIERITNRTSSIRLQKFDKRVDNMTNITNKQIDINALYQQANPVIQQQLINRKLISSIEPINLETDPSVTYWFSMLNLRGIHGRTDNSFENVMAKLLQFGFDRSNDKIDTVCKELLASDIWTQNHQFDQEIEQIVAAPFLLHAGYHDHETLTTFIAKRITKIRNTIQTYKDEFFDDMHTYYDQDDSYVFPFDSKTGSFPTIYDLYLLAHLDGYTNEKQEILEFILTTEFQQIPTKAYIYDSIKKRYYAAGNVYHAVHLNSRTILYLYLLSKFEQILSYPYAKTLFSELQQFQQDTGWYQFPKEYLKEQKNSYHMYSGSHMGMNQSRRTKDWQIVESTYWMIQIEHNLNQKVQSL